MKFSVLHTLRVLRKTADGKRQQSPTRIPNAKTKKAMKELEPGKGKCLGSIYEIIEEPDD